MGLPRSFAAMKNHLWGVSRAVLPHQLSRVRRYVVKRLPVLSRVRLLFSPALKKLYPFLTIPAIFYSSSALVQF